jgi:carbonic anhydrase/acetyltransferase-like protein (isoleucine patch superfamily)
MLIRYLDFTPSVAAPLECAPTAAIVGRTVAGPGLVLRSYATLRADGEWVRIGANAYFGERATVHIADATFAANIGDDVTVGRFALVHACTVENRVVVGDTAIVMDDAHVGSRRADHGGQSRPAAQAAPRRMDLRRLSRRRPCARSGPTSSQPLRARFRQRIPSTLVTATDLPPARHGAVRAGARRRRGFTSRRAAAHAFVDAYVAPTALLAGDVTVAAAASVYFSCALVAGDGRIAIGPRTNVQDNSLLVTDAARGPLELGAGRHHRPQCPHGRRDDR